jgi:hypothetical protein
MASEPQLQPQPEQPSAEIPLEAIQAPPLDDEIVDNAPISELAERERSMYRRQVIRGLSQDIEERKTYAHRTFCLISCWLGGVFLLVLFQGFHGNGTSYFDLDKTVLVTVVGSTTATVLGIFIVVMHYLFPSKPSEPNKE